MRKVLMLMVFFTIALTLVVSKRVDASAVSLPDAELMLSEFQQSWGSATENSRTDVAGPGVLFTITGLSGGGSGWKDDYMLNSLAGGTGGHNADFTAYDSYVMCFTNQSEYTIDVSLFMNTGFTGASGSPPNNWQNDTFWSSGWVAIAAGEDAYVTLDFSNAQAWNIADDPDRTGLTDGGWYSIHHLDEVSAIGFEVADFAGDTNGEQISLLVGDSCCESVPVPEPTSLLLIGSGLIGLVGLRRKFIN